MQTSELTIHSHYSLCDCNVLLGPGLGCLTYLPDSAASANQTRAEPDTGPGGVSPQPSARGH